MIRVRQTVANVRIKAYCFVKGFKIVWLHVGVVFDGRDNDRFIAERSTRTRDDHAEPMLMSHRSCGGRVPRSPRGAQHYTFENVTLAQRIVRTDGLNNWHWWRCCIRRQVG